MSTHFAHTRPRARVAHTCSLCRRRIDPGETYRRGAGMDGSTAWTFIECAHCAALAAYVFSLRGDDEYDVDLLVEWEPETIPHLRLKAIATRRQWRHADGSLYPIPETVYQRDQHGFGWPADVLLELANPPSEEA